MANLTETRQFPHPQTHHRVTDDVLNPPRPYRWKYQHVRDARKKGFVKVKKAKPDG